MDSVINTKLSLVMSLSASRLSFMVDLVVLYYWDSATLHD